MCWVRHFCNSTLIQVMLYYQCIPKWRWTSWLSNQCGWQYAVNSCLIATQQLLPLLWFKCATLIPVSDHLHASFGYLQICLAIGARFSVMSVGSPPTSTHQLSKWPSHDNSTQSLHKNMPLASNSSFWDAWNTADIKCGSTFEVTTRYIIKSNNYCTHETYITAKNCSELLKMLLHL